MSWIERLKTKWNITSGFQFFMIMWVFACTGTTVVFVKKPVIAFLTSGEEPSVWFTVGYFILILPIYNVILLCYGFIFGQFSFFWEYEKKMISRFNRKKKDAVPQAAGD